MTDMFDKVKFDKHGLLRFYDSEKYVKTERFVNDSEMLVEKLDSFYKYIDGIQENMSKLEANLSQYKRKLFGLRIKKQIQKEDLKKRQEQLKQMKIEKEMKIKTLKKENASIEQQGTQIMLNLAKILN